MKKIVFAIAALFCLPLAAQEIAEQGTDEQIVEQIIEDLKSQGRHQEADYVSAQRDFQDASTSWSATPPPLQRNPFVQYPDWVTTGEHAGRACVQYAQQCYVWSSSPPVSYCRVCCVGYMTWDGMPYGQSISGYLYPLSCTQYY